MNRGSQTSIVIEVCILKNSVLGVPKGGQSGQSDKISRIYAPEPKRMVSKWFFNVEMPRGRMDGCSGHYGAPEWPSENCGTFQFLYHNYAFDGSIFLSSFGI